MTNKMYISNILDILGQADIKTLDDLENKPESISVTLSNNSKNWVMDFYNITKEHFDSYFDLINRTDSNRVYFISNTTDIETIKYMCLFPSSIMLVDNFSVGYTAGSLSANFTIKKSFIKEIIQNKQYINNDIFTILPKRFDINYPYNRSPQIHTLSGIYQNYDQYEKLNYIGKNGMLIENDYLDSLFISLPWLYGARPDDYLQIINKYSTHYEHYKMQIYKLLKMYKNGESNIEDLYYDIKNAHIEMKIHLEKAQHTLYTKGIPTILGLAFTFLPLVLDIPSELKIYLQTIFGVTSMNAVLSTIFTERQNLKYYGINDPYFVTYKWEEITKKKKLDKNSK